MLIFLISILNADLALANPALQCDGLFKVSSKELVFKQQVLAVPEICRLITHAGNTEINFILDNFYGTETPLIKTGEAIQTLNLIKVLKTIFPNAKFHPKQGHRIDQNGNILPLFYEEEMAYKDHLKSLSNPVLFSIIDSAEHGIFRPPNEQSAQRIEMIDVKPGLSSPTIKNHQNSRKDLNLMEDLKIAHVYDRLSTRIASVRRGTDDFPDLAQIAHSLLNRNFKTVIITARNSGGTSAPVSMAELIETHPGLGHLFDKIVYLSQVKDPNEIDSNRRTLIINDTQGQMMKIHSASDLALIVGPINFFEPLFVGTPTILFSGYSTLQGYSRAGLNHMVSAASAFPHFINIESWQKFDQVNVDMKRSEVKEAPLLRGFLEILARKIAAQLNLKLN